MNPNQVGAAAFVILILSGVPVSAKVLESDGSQESVRALLSAASDGDTITLPSGTFSWTAPLKITKNITLRGNTTISGAGTSGCSANDLTIVQDDVLPRKFIMNISVTPDPAKTFRMTGITFAPGALTSSGSTGAFHIQSTGSQPLYNVRIDNCHFALLYQSKIVFPTGRVYGVFDHNFVEARGAAFPFNPENGGDANGNESWADYPWYGTNKFFFIETNSFTRTGTFPRALTDGYKGARYVVRHNYIKNCSVQSHGTEGGAPRGQRCEEVYDNEFNATIVWAGHGIRSGGALVHDNIFTGLSVSKPPHVWSLINYRSVPGRPYNTWGNADGTSVWDVNATEADGSHVDGQPPYLFDSGTVTGASVIFVGQATITDSTKNWTPDNKWGPKKYSITNTTPGATAYTLGSFCLSSTATTLTYFYYAANDAPVHLTFAVGDEYQIHKVNIMLDQCGRGKGDLLAHVSSSTVGAITLPTSRITASTVAGFPTTGGDIYIGHNRVHYTGISRHTFTGCTGGSGAVPGGTSILMQYIASGPRANQQTWPVQALEPCYSWNNVYIASPTPTPAPGATPTGAQWGMFIGGQPTTRLGTDYFNLGAKGWDTTPSDVSSTYVAAFNGVDYTRPYVYPHPLVTGAPAPSPTPSATPCVAKQRKPR